MFPDDACVGTAAACDTIADEGVCDSQAGCFWTVGEAICTGSNECGTFTDVPAEFCSECGCTPYGCGGGTCGCRDEGDACETFGNPAVCERCGCDWILTEVCRGAHQGCDQFHSADPCNRQLGCSWFSGTCTDYTCG